MKQNKFLKALIIIAAILVVGYIVYNSYQVTEVRNLVEPIKAYSFSSHVDSMCAKIQSSELEEAIDDYTKLYQEIDVVSKIKTKNGDSYLSSDSADYLFKKSFEAVWPLYKNFAENLFRQNRWRSNDLSTIINCNKKFHINNKDDKNFKKGVSNQADDIKNYRNYVNGYNVITNGLSKAESCSNRDDYEKVTKLKNYRGFPYSNLRNLQEQIDGAERRAAEHWQKVLKDNAQTLLNQHVEIERNSIDSYNNAYKQWFTDKEIYINTTNDHNQELINFENYISDRINQLYNSLNTSSDSSPRFNNY